MGSKKLRMDNCCLCGEYKELSFEHVPPRSAFNNKPIFIQGFTHLTDRSSPLYGRSMKSNKGFGGYTLCKSCNSNTGTWYARDFAEFAHQGMSIMNSYETPLQSPIINGRFKINPLNVIKQILTMFMSADKSGHLQSQKDLVSYLLEKESKKLPERYQVYLYYTLSPKKRMVGYSIVWDPVLGAQKWSEINFQPFGYLLTEDSKPAHKYMCNISRFSQIDFGKTVELDLSAIYLPIENVAIGQYPY